ncbi:MAG: hypothetical protein IPN66_04755 [Candidatus Competibacteraceae bacterium]|jgi:hypothetical protein|nr:hypothetical protein [Candidatus Competibacteraceae bacterium]
MKTETREPEDVSQDILRKGQELVAQIQAMLDETDRLYRQHGLDRGSARRFLESGSLSPAQKAKAEQELEQFLQEVERDIERDLSNTRSASRESAKPKFRAMRI